MWCFLSYKCYVHRTIFSYYNLIFLFLSYIRDLNTLHAQFELFNILVTLVESLLKEVFSYDEFFILNVIVITWICIIFLEAVGSYQSFLFN